MKGSTVIPRVARFQDTNAPDPGVQIASRACADAAARVVNAAGCERASRTDRIRDPSVHCTSSCRREENVGGMEWSILEKGMAGWNSEQEHSVL